ncbi:BolA/IbaG family iron-sulfur metabolism protein [Candidatus Synchoanobacter obligatus]|uniref:BolA/IbaG family iron-sulfur metabolism protein n=1 Tax=Candidatus Synchoanobacter obligatus TaxID=2919597 RepID=A0ABT1L4I9_9GAMM|nr:BolA/IbaG family iron-sulfur metabolism protein [Candidatus Synchoanobacter obligatus]MCP8352082.1 BolA/IbaG family iron-sulfur metabolism protein [Candidatus Synchoanobacter obligatus]
MNEIIELLKREIPDSEILFDGGGSRVSIAVTSPFFSGMSRLQRQRYVKKLLEPWIDSGSLHAVTLKVSSGEEI